MEKRNLLILSGLLGIFFYFILPGWIKIFAFLIPTIALSYVYSNRNLNYYIIIGVSFLYLLFPSSIFTLDATTSIQTTLDTWIVSPLSVIIGLVIFVPMIIAVVSLILAVINIVNPASWATGNVSLDAESTIKTILKIIIVIAMVVIFALLGSLLGWKIYGIEWLQGVLARIWEYLVNLPNMISNNDTVIHAIDLSTDPQDFSLTTVLSALSNRKILGLTITSIYPLCLSIVVIIIGIFYHITKSQPKGTKDNSNQFERPLTLNLSFVIFLIAILIIAFMFYLSYSIDSFINYQNIGFFGIYLIITSVVCVFLASGIGSPTKNSKDSIFGVIFGVMLLFMYQNMFQQTQTLNIISNEYTNLTIIQILNNFVFVAPTESLLFHIFLPSLVIFYYMRKNVVFSESELQNRISELKNQILILETSANIHKEIKDVKSYAKTEKQLVKVKSELSRLENQTKIGIKNTTHTLSNQQFVIYLVSVIGFNVLFSILHWFKSGLTFEVFWTSGLGFLYLSSGVIISLVSYKFGWMSGILSHAIHNSTILFLVQLTSVM